MPLGILKNSASVWSGLKSSFPSVLNDGNTVAWYDSQLLRTITKDGSDFVSRWNDRLGSGHDLIQAVGTNQPKWFSVNGILFDGIDNFMKTAAFTFDQPEMIYIVFKQITWTNTERIFDGFNNVSMLMSQSGITPELNIFAGAASPNDGSLPINTFGIVRALYNGVNSSLQINENAKWTGNAGASNAGGLTIGAQSSGALFGNIQLKEFIGRKIADGAVDDAAIFNYLKNKYGTP